MNAKVNFRWLNLLSAIAAAMVLALGTSAFMAASANAEEASSAPAKSALQAKGKNITGKASTKTLFTYGWEYPNHYTATTKTVKGYDVTGDKKADTVKFELTGESNGYTKGLNIYINGKKKLRVTDNAGGMNAKVKLLTTKNRNSFLYVQYTGNNADGTYALYRYKGGKLKPVLTSERVNRKFTTAHRYIDSIKASGNKVVVVYAPMTLTASMIYLKFEYPCDKAGQLSLKKPGKVYTVKNYPAGYANKALTAATSMQAFTSSSLKTRKFTIRSGDEVTFLGCSMTKSQLAFKVKVGKQSGWIAAQTKPGPQSGTYFQGVGLAG